MTDTTSQLTSGGYYLSAIGQLFQFTGDPASAEDRRTGWVLMSPSVMSLGYKAPSQAVSLVPGPTYVATVDEPSGVGAVVTESDSGTWWVKNPDGLWHSEDGRALSWSDIAHPIVRSQGVQTS